MSFGIQTFNEGGSVDFDSISPHMGEIHRRSVGVGESHTIKDELVKRYV